MSLHLEAKSLYEEARTESEKADRFFQARRIRKWRMGQREEAEDVIRRLRREIPESAKKGERFIDAMYLEREDGSHEDGALGHDINRLRGSAKIVRNWARAEGFNVSVEFTIGNCNDGHFWLRISW